MHVQSVIYDGKKIKSENILLVEQQTSPTSHIQGVESTGSTPLSNGVFLVARDLPFPNLVSECSISTGELSNLIFPNICLESQVRLLDLSGDHHKNIIYYKISENGHKATKIRIMTDNYHIYTFQT